MSSYPRRAGAQPCQYYLKTGKCNYGQRCKFDHPQRNKQLLTALSRRDCFDYVQSSNCPYGLRCKYNHPPLDSPSHVLTDGQRKHMPSPHAKQLPQPLPLSLPTQSQFSNSQPLKHVPQFRQLPIPDRDFSFPTLMDDPINTLRDGALALEWGTPKESALGRTRVQPTRGFDPLAYDAQLFGSRPSWAPTS